MIKFQWSWISQVTFCSKPAEFLYSSPTLKSGVDFVRCCSQRSYSIDCEYTPLRFADLLSPSVSTISIFRLEDVWSTIIILEPFLVPHLGFFLETQSLPQS